MIRQLVAGSYFLPLHLAALPNHRHENAVRKYLSTAPMCATRLARSDGCLTACSRRRMCTRRAGGSSVARERPTSSEGRCNEDEDEAEEEGAGAKEEEDEVDGRREDDGKKEEAAAIDGAEKDG